MRYLAVAGVSCVTDRLAEQTNSWIARWWGVSVSIALMVIASAAGFAWQSNIKLAELGIRVEVMNQERAQSGLVIKENITELKRQTEVSSDNQRQRLDTIVAVLAALQGRSDVIEARMSAQEERTQVQQRAIEQLRADLRELDLLRNRGPKEAR